MLQTFLRRFQTIARVDDCVLSAAYSGQAQTETIWVVSSVSEDVGYFM